MKFKSIFLSLIFCLFLWGCNSSKKSSIGNVTTSNLVGVNTEHLYTELVASYNPWEELYVPVVLSLEEPKKMSISGRATLTYDQEIYISLRMLGMEVGQMYISKENIYVVDKFHKNYFMVPLANVLQGYDITMADLQNILLGRAVVPGKGLITDGDIQKFTFLQGDDQWILTPKQTFKGADWHYIATKTDPPLLSSISLRAPNDMVMQCQFSEPTHTFAGIVDAITTLTLPYKDSVIKVSINWGLYDAKWNTGRGISFNPPGGGYKQLDVETLLKTFE